jgi:predicted HTH transcriptional regulator
MAELTVTDSEIINYIKYPNEERHLEFKDDVKWDGNIRAKIAKSIMAMANLRDGGWIVIGKHENTDRSFGLVGLGEENYNSFDPDEMKAYVYAMTDPPVDFKVYRKEHEGKKYVLLQVKEFENTPIICKKSCGTILHNGTIYARSKGKPESVPVPTSAEMREITDIAIDKGVEAYIKRSKRVNVLVVHPEIEIQDDENEFAKEREDLL